MAKNISLLCEEEQEKELRTSLHTTMNNDGGETTAKRLDQQKVTLYKLFSFADQSDVVLMTVGTISGMANGCSRPLMTVMLGKTINKFGSTDQSQIVHELSKVYIYICVCISISIYIYITSVNLGL